MKNLFNDAKFKWEWWDENCRLARFEFEYVQGVRNYVKGDLRIFLGNMLDHKRYDKKRKKHFVYINCFSVDYITKMINYFRKNKKWKNCSGRDVDPNEKRNR